MTRRNTSKNHIEKITSRITSNKYSKKMHDFCAVEVQRQKLVITMKKIHGHKKVH